MDLLSLYPPTTAFSPINDFSTPTLKSSFHLTLPLHFSMIHPYYHSDGRKNKLSASDFPFFSFVTACHAQNSWVCFHSGRGSPCLDESHFDMLDLTWFWSVQMLVEWHVQEQPRGQKLISVSFTEGRMYKGLQYGHCLLNWKSWISWFVQKWKNNHKNKNKKMDGLCFVFSVLLTVHGEENVYLNKSFVVHSGEIIHR